MHRQAVKAGETAKGLRAYAEELARDGNQADRWLKAKKAHTPAKWHRAAVKKAKAEGRRAFQRKSSAARRAAKSKAAK
jgi:hypothetical protein